MKKVEGELHDVVPVHQLNKKKMEQALQVTREYLGEEHQHVELYVILSFYDFEMYVTQELGAEFSVGS